MRHRLFPIHRVPDFKSRTGQARLAATAVIVATCGIIAMFLAQRSVRELPNHSTTPPESAALISLTPPAETVSSTQPREGSDIALAHRIERLPRPNQRNSWIDPFNADLWETSGWSFATNQLTSSESAIGRAIFRQPYSDLSLSCRLILVPSALPKSDVANDELFEVAFVNETESTRVRIAINEQQTWLEEAVDQRLLPRRDVPTEIPAEGCILRIVLTSDRLLTFMNDQFLWNTARPAQLPDAFYVCLKSTNRAVTISELRLECSRFAEANP